MYGIFHNTSIIGIIVSVILVFLILVYRVFEGNVRNICQFFICLLVILLFLSKSRAGWFAFIAISAFYLPGYGVIKKYNISRRFLFGVILFTFAFLFLLKRDSSIGRIYIYRISLDIFADNPLTGIGIGKFKATFNEYQADFFSNNDIDSKRALLADNTFYAFNDYLQWAAETGIIGVLTLGLALFYLIKRTRVIQRISPHKPITRAVAASLLCLAVAALFSYPLQTIPGQFLGLILVGIILFYPLEIKTAAWRVISVIIRFMYISLSAYFLIHSIYNIKSKIGEEKAYKLELYGFKAEAMKEYKTLSHYYPSNGYNTFKYAELQYYRNQLNEARITLEVAQKTYIDNRVYKLKAKIENELGNFREAEKYYLKTVYMVPNRMLSRYDLMNFYISCRDTLGAIKWAHSILNMPVKVPSEKTKMMLNATKDSLSKWNISN